MKGDELERLIARELVSLPTPAAPRTLLPRVLAAAAHRHRGAVPGLSLRVLGWRLASTLGVLAVVAGAAAIATGAIAIPEAALQTGRNLRDGVAVLTGPIRQVSTLCRVLWMLLAPLGLYVLALSLSFSLACAALWSALNRFALGGARRT